MNRKSILNLLLGEVIKKRRIRKGLNQQQLAEKADMDRTHINEIENGLINPTYNTLYGIALALDTVPSSISKEVEQKVTMYFNKDKRSED